MITAIQCRGARAMLEWSREVLASESKVSARAIQDFENEKRNPNPATLQALRHAFEIAGAQLTPDGAVRVTGMRGITRDPVKEGREHEIE